MSALRVGASRRGSGSRGARLGWIALAAALPALAASSAAEELLDGIAAQVGSEIVLVSEVNQLAAPVEAQLREGGAPESEILNLRATVLDRLIERRLIQIVVRRAELEATDAEVDETVSTIAAENGLSLDELRQSVEAQGLPFDAYRERIRSEIEQAKVIKGVVASRVRVEEDEIRALYAERFSDQPTHGDEVHLRHLLVALRDDSPGARSEACAGAEEALARIRSGEDFTTVAREVSVANPERGGDIGWVHEDSLAGWMRPVVEALRPGETSEVLATAFGCNLLQLVERRTYQEITYEEARPRLRGELFDQRMQEQYLEFVNKIRAQTYIERKGIYAEASRVGPGPEPTTRENLVP